MNRRPWGGELVAEFRALTSARDPVAEPWRLRRITLRLLVLVLLEPLGKGGVAAAGAYGWALAGRHPKVGSSGWVRVGWWTQLRVGAVRRRS